MFDFGSPNAFLSHEAIPAIEQRAGAKFDYVPILLGGVFKATNNKSPAETLAGVKNKREFHAIETERFIKRFQVAPFVWNPFFPVNTLNLMRAAIAAQFEGVFESYVEAAFHHMWREPKKMDDLEVAVKALNSSGLDGAKLLARAQEADVKAKLIENTQSAVERGAFGSPTFFVGKEMFFGKEQLRGRGDGVGQVTPRLAVIASEAKQSRGRTGSLDCFVASLLAMTTQERWRAMMEKRNATVAVIGAGDYIGAEIAKKFASEGFTVFAGRRDGEKLEPLVKEVETAGGVIFGRSLDARKEEEIVAFLNDADKHAPLEVCIFNVGANVNFPILETTDRVFRKVWEMACWAGFLAGRESARLMLPRGRGNIFFTGATASLRGGSGFTAFASAKFGLRAVAQSMARELGPQNIHVAHLIIDSGVDTAWVRERREKLWGKEALDNPDLLMPPASVAASYWQLYQQPRSAWTFEMEIRPFGEKW